MVPANGTVVDNDVCQAINQHETQKMRQLCTYPKPRAQQRSTDSVRDRNTISVKRCLEESVDNARTFFTSNRFFASPLSTALPVEVAGGSTSIAVSAMRGFVSFAVVAGERDRDGWGREGSDEEDERAWEAYLCECDG